ncbi:MAG: carbamoyl-phosphate synthase large subunit, partial [Oscillospiraceae bacterium]|nr:carbamoyl-phosphate synthase large subunit [Oscillospiraceae bacterium]
HTGDSIVGAPAVTLTPQEFGMLRSAALNIVQALGVEGGCNCQFALKPDSFEYAVIEVNPRVSRSSALASKATGYPIAKVATKIAIGYTLDEIMNQVTGKTYASFEPTIDYLVVKFPKWPFDKFVYAKKTLGTQMKATGEVMAIGTSFEAGMMKAVRSIELGMDTLTKKALTELSDEEIEKKLYDVDVDRCFCIFEALKRGISVERIHEITMVDSWFINKLNNLVKLEKWLAEGELTQEKYDAAKKYCYLDSTIERISGQKVQNRKLAVYKMVDTCAAEFAAETPYFYNTFDEENEAKEFIEQHPTDKKKIIVFGSGPIRIGQGIEFDYCSVHCVWSLKEEGCEAVICNNNPETVSTDFDTGDRLYFDPLTREDVEALIETEKPYGVVVQFGGQTAIKLTKHLTELGVRILGTSAADIDAAEDRELFDELLEKCGIPRPQGSTVFTTEEALKVANQLGYPVLLRPSYVLGGQNMIIAHCDNDVQEYMTIITATELENPVLIDKYMMGTEVEVDAICDGENFLIPGIMEHVERAGVHSGDSISVYPCQTLTPHIKRV